MPPCPAPDTCWVYLVRHGATANNRENPPRLQGRRTDPELSPEGHRQAEQAGQALSGHRLDAVFSSPLLRARQTAEAIALPHDLKIDIVDDLVEVDVGDWEGRAWDEIERTDPEAYRLFMTDASIHPYLGGENFSVLEKRVVPAMQRLMQDNLGRVIAVAAHNCVNRVYLTTLLGMPLSKYRSLPQDNCGINLLRFRGGRVKAVTINNIEHLDGE